MSHHHIWQVSSWRGDFPNVDTADATLRCEVCGTSVTVRTAPTEGDDRD